jgi:hypothetical protein
MLNILEDALELENSEGNYAGKKLKHEKSATSWVLS